MGDCCMLIPTAQYIDVCITNWRLLMLDIHTIFILMNVQINVWEFNNKNMELKIGNLDMKTSSSSMHRPFYCLTGVIVNIVCSNWLRLFDWIELSLFLLKFFFYLNRKYCLIVHWIFSPLSHNARIERFQMMDFSSIIIVISIKRSI